MRARPRIFGGRRWSWLGLAWSLGLFAPADARADAVNDAFAAGNLAASQEDWAEAIEHYERAHSLAQAPSAVLAYNLGTAYGHTGDLGRAVFNFRRAERLDDESVPELGEGIRHNLAEVRRRAEVKATLQKSQIDRPRTWQDVVARGLRATPVGALALLCGWAFVVGFAVMRLTSARHRSRQVWTAALGLLAVLYVALGVAHGLALRADLASPAAIVLDATVQAHEGPGAHRPVAFTLRGGAEVRIVDRAPGWRRVRLPGGLEGWVAEERVGVL